MDYAATPVEDWEQRAIAAGAKATVLAIRVEQEIPALQARVAKLEGDWAALKSALQKTLV